MRAVHLWLSFRLFLQGLCFFGSQFDSGGFLGKISSPGVVEGFSSPPCFAPFRSSPRAVARYVPSLRTLRGSLESWGEGGWSTGEAL